MKKIYSFVLMAAMLLVGTSAWAVDVSSYEELKEAFKGESATITLTEDIYFSEATDVIWIGTACIDDTPKSFTLDLNGHDIIRQAAKATGNHYHFFVLTHGTLKVINSAATNDEDFATIGFEEGGTSAANTSIFFVTGSYKAASNFSNLEIGKNVKLNLPEGCLGTGIVVDVIKYDGSKTPQLNNTVTNGVPRWASENFYNETADADKRLNYFTEIVKNTANANRGFAYGVNVEFKGMILSMGAKYKNSNLSTEKSYGIKSNGNLESPKSKFAYGSQTTTDCMSADATYFTNYNVNDRVADASYVPYIHVCEGAYIETSNKSTKSAAVYASGYAHWLIEGICKGNLGISASSGDIDLNGAKVSSTSNTYVAPDGNQSVSGAGSAIVINARDGYAGGVDMTITGNSEIKATAGYAIDEKVNTTSDGDKVEKIAIESAAITGGNEGAIIIAEADRNDASVYAATIDGTITVGAQDVSNETTLGGLIKGTTTSDTNPGSFDSDKDYILNVNTTGDKPVIEVKPNTSKVVTMNAYGWSTFSATVARDLTSDVTAYKAKYSDEGGVQKLTLTEFSGTIPADEGVILFGTPNATYSLNATTSDPDHLTDNDLKPESAWADQYASGNFDFFVLHDNQMYQYVGATMKANKAYLPISKASGAPKRIQMVIAETQDIENVEFEAVKAVKFIENGQVLIKRGEKVYNVQGQIVK